MHTLNIPASNVLDLEILLAQNGFSVGQLSPGTIGVDLPSGGALVAYGAFTEEGTTFYAVDIHNLASLESGEDNDALALPGYLVASQVLQEVRSCWEGTTF